MSIKFLDKTGLDTLWTKIKAVFAPKENGVFYVAGTHGYTAWVANKAYAVNDQVVYSSVAYYCKTAHTSGTSFDSSKWTKIATPVWTGTVSGITALYTGMKIAYKIPIAGGSSSTYLNINNLGNKYVYRNAGNTTTHLPTNTIVFLTYDGTYWKWADYSVGDNYYAATDLYCSTAAATAAKAATGIGFNHDRHKNIAFRIYFTNANTVQGQLTLNVNSQGAKNLFINGTNSSSSNYTIPIGVYWCYYDGTQWQLWTDKSIWGLKVRGDGSNLTEAFTTASSRSNIATGESNATIFGKIAKWFSDLKALAFKDKVGAGDVESGTYSISVSGNAGTATNPQVTLLTSANDLNNIKGDGIGVWWYRWASSSVPANAQSNSTSYMEVVRMHAGNYLFQIAYGATHSNVYIRICNNGSWGSWYRCATTSEIPSSSDTVFIYPIDTTEPNVWPKFLAAYNAGKQMFATYWEGVVQGVARKRILPLVGVTTNSTDNTPTSFTFGMPYCETEDNYVGRIVRWTLGGSTGWVLSELDVTYAESADTSNKAINDASGNNIEASYKKKTYADAFTTSQQIKVPSTTYAYWYIGNSYRRIRVGVSGSGNISIGEETGGSKSPSSSTTIIGSSGTGNDTTYTFNGKANSAENADYAIGIKHVGSAYTNVGAIGSPIVCPFSSDVIPNSTTSYNVESLMSKLLGQYNQYKAEENRCYVIINARTATMRITGFYGNASYELGAGKMTTIVYWGGQYFCR